MAAVAAAPAAAVVWRRHGAGLGGFSEDPFGERIHQATTLWLVA